MTHFQIDLAEDYCIGRFQAMASPCEILVDSLDQILASHLTGIAQKEALRIEAKFSRYRTDNIIHKINSNAGKKVKVDNETAHLLDYAAQCFQLSEGLFDITSGVLRKVWKFDGSDNIPSKDSVSKLLKYIGWNKIRWKSPYITLQQNMEIDFGGIGKEYAVDRVALALRAESEVACLVNFGGDLMANRVRASGKSWVVGVEAVDAKQKQATSIIELSQGGMATSGDARRFLLKDGIRYSHVLNPITGWPVSNAPRSVSVLADSCTEAGTLATLALLNGSNAEQFLQQQQVKYWCIR